MAVIRKITAADAVAFLQLKRALDHETYLMLFQQDELLTTAAQMNERLKKIEKLAHTALFAAERDGQMIGFTAAIGNEQKRISHRARIVTGVLKAWRRLGYGRLLLEKAENWAKENGIFRLELAVTANNRPGMLFYGTTGFQVEGTRKAAVVQDGEHVDEFYMAKLL
ncbi:GNAT family N-acetyltransferase [Sporolactobacillus putidus]|uniref:N-acetyltransferase GCN5 n=1 Tax=Sporolactobacillus putidus TaxID=492735 RepID=A0A917RXR1_9BACL|nr:GNAT family N-acetyltransferase [Sporolactobacillus putidus]GGL44960.1 N-acetyltransferase GCN5 [Sporolactobacillus putidus]